MRRPPRLGLFGLLSLSASVLVSGQGRAGAPAPPSAASPPRIALAERIAHTDPTRYRSSPAVHGGAGKLDFFALFNPDAIDANLQFLHRGVIEAKSGIGQHFHNYCEEMFVILDGEAQFTVDGRTSTLKGPAGAPARMGHAHAIYNATDTPVQWLNINVASFHGIYDTFDLGDTRVGAPLDPVPQFISMQLDPSQAQPIANFQGGTGTVQYRRAPGSVGLLHDLGLRRSPAAARRHVGRPRLGAGHRRLLLRDERRRHGHDRQRDRADQERRRHPGARGRNQGLRQRRHDAARIPRRRRRA